MPTIYLVKVCGGIVRRVEGRAAADALAAKLAQAFIGVSVEIEG